MWNLLKREDQECRRLRDAIEAAAMKSADAVSVKSLTEPLAAHDRKHLETCADCRNAVQDLVAMKELFRGAISFRQEERPWFAARVMAANAPMPEPERRAKRVAELTEELGLTSDQAKRLDAILLQRHTEAKAVHEQADGQLEKIRQSGRDQIRAILTPEQKPKFEEFLQKLDAEKKHNAPK